MKAKIAAMMSTVAVLGIAPQASATVFSVTYQGFVTALDATYAPTSAPVLDVEDLFGGGDLQGDAVTATYVYDTSLGTLTSTQYPLVPAPPTPPPTPFPGPDVELDGGLAFGASSPILSATFTIDGYSFSYAPDYYANVSTGYGVFDLTDQGNDIFGTAETATSLDGADSELTFQTDNAPSTNLLKRYNSDGIGFGYLDTPFDTLQNSDAIGLVLTHVSAAPEPSTWALMIAGLGLTGFALRRRNEAKLVTI